MSLLLLIFYWIVVPVLVFLFARMVFRAMESKTSKRLVVIATLACFAWMFWLAAGEKWWLDYQVRELCAVDGGIKVYEVVKLPPELIGKYGGVMIPSIVKAKPWDPYYYESKTHYYREGNPQMSRTQYSIIRHSDGKVLGESIRYSRGGGDLPGPWHGSSYMCPPIKKGLPQLETSVFIKDDKK